MQDIVVALQGQGHAQAPYPGIGIVAVETSGQAEGEFGLGQVLLAELRPANAVLRFGFDLVSDIVDALQAVGLFDSGGKSINGRLKIIPPIR